MPDYSTYKAEDFLLDDSFIGYCLGDPHHTDFWNNFVTQHPEMQQEIDRAVQLHSAVAIRSSVKEKQLALERLRKDITGLTRTSGEAPVYTMPPAAVKWRRYIMAAAVFTGVLIAGIVLYLRTETHSVEQVYATAADFAKAHYGQEYHAKPDERLDITLPDGSVATLNYGSTLKVTDDYNKSKRWLYLDGEAFFSVQPDKEKPFVVITAQNATTALGTSFKVRDYAEDSRSDVMLATGKVKVQSMTNESAEGQLLLVPGESAAFEGNSLPVKRSFNQDILQNWRTLRIEFDKAGMDDIIAAFEFYYGVKVKLQNKPERPVAFTGKFTNKPLQDVLEAISFTNKFSYTKSGNTISILFQ